MEVHGIEVVPIEDADSLDAKDCGDPSCADEHPRIGIRPKCHRGPVAVTYMKATQTVDLHCMVCGNLAVRILVGRKL